MTEVTRIFDLLERYKSEYKNNKNVFSYKENGQWKAYSAGEYVERANRISSAFLNIGVKPGDKVVTVINNSPVWNFVDMGLQQIGAIQIPIYPTTSIEHYKHIFIETEVKVVILSEKAVYDKIKPALDDTVQHLYTFEKTEDLEHWEDFLAKGQNSREEEITALKNKVKPDDTATIIYTSGTTGPPKGVMLTHRNFISTVLGVIEIIDQNPVKTAISFLPLCHVYERMLSYFYQYKNITVYYAESIEALGDNLREVQPEMFCAVPRVLEKTYDKIINKGRNLPLLPKIIFYWALRLGEQYDHHEQKGWWYLFQLKIANMLVFKKWRKGLGGNLKLIVSGGATLQSKLARTFWAAGIDVMEGYGLTETSPVIAVSNYIDNGIKIGTVGPVLKGVQVKFADDGEILCKGPNVMKGYYRQPEKTKEVLGNDGWFKTGDIGHLENGRFLKITDRKKEMFKTSGGKYIAPQVIENMMKGSPFIENVLVVGDNKKFPAALVVPNFYHLRSWCNVKGITYTNDKEMIENQRIIDRYEREVAEMNQHFGKVEQIKKIALLSEPWGIETGELSPTLKLKRRVLYQKYEETIEALYEEA
jgi:long-chain acyl-CoA synthetase